MTQYTIIAGQSVPTVPTGPSPAQVVVNGSPSLGIVAMTVAGPNRIGTRASLWVQTATAPYGYTQTLPLLSFYIPPGSPPHQEQRLALGDLQYQQFLFGQVDQIDRSGLTSVSMTLVV